MNEAPATMASFRCAVTKSIYGLGLESVSYCRLGRLLRKTNRSRCGLVSQSSSSNHQIFPPSPRISVLAGSCRTASRFSTCGSTSGHKSYSVLGCSSFFGILSRTECTERALCGSGLNTQGYKTLCLLSPSCREVCRMVYYSSDMLGLT